MVMHEPRPWRVLCVCEDPNRARTIATTLSAMEYPARLRCGLTERRLSHDEAIDGPVGVEVPSTDWHDLSEILESLLDEQDEFDASLVRRKLRHGRVRRIVIGAAGTVGAVAILRWLLDQ